MLRKRPAPSGAFVFEVGDIVLVKESPTFKAPARCGSAVLVHNKYPSLSTRAVEKPSVPSAGMAIYN